MRLKTVLRCLVVSPVPMLSGPSRLKAAKRLKMRMGAQQMKNTIMRLTEFEVAYKKMTADYTKSTATIKDYEGKFNGMNMKVNELTSINNQLVTVRTKMDRSWTR